MVSWMNDWANRRSWTRILTKQPEKFKAVVDTLKETLLGAMSKQYARLRERVIDHELERLTRYTEEALNLSNSHPSVNAQHGPGSPSSITFVWPDYMIDMTEFPSNYDG